MFKKLLYIVLMCVVNYSNYAQEIVLNNPNIVVKKSISNLFERLEKDKKILSENLNHYNVIMSEELLPYIDYKYAAYRVLGREISTTTQIQREKFAEVFKQYMITTFSQAFVNNYRQQKLQFNNDIQYDNVKVVNISVFIVGGDSSDSNEKIIFSFLLRKNKSEQWKIFDLIVENISMLSSQQSDITFSIRKKGFDYVLKELEKKGQMDIVLKSQN